MIVPFKVGVEARKNVLVSRGLRRGEQAGDTGSNGTARGASASRGLAGGREAGATRPATRAPRAPAAAAPGASWPTPLASPPLHQHQHRRRTAAAAIAVIAAPLTSVPSDLCGRQIHPWLK